jgi:hypothetical protein
VSIRPGGKLILGVYHPWGKLVKKLFNINYKNNILYQDQECHPYETAFTISQVKKLFPNSPRILEIEKIHKITDKYFLIDLESKYDKFIVKNQHLLMLYDLIEDLLDIRDAILIRVGRLKRQELMSGIH